jgi:hypothetical protein
MNFAIKPSKQPTVSATHFLIGRNDVVEDFTVHAGRERGRADQIREHHRHLTAFGGVWGPRFGLWRCRYGPRQFPDRPQHLQPVPKRDSKLFEVLIGQVGEERQINTVFSKPLRGAGSLSLAAVSLSSKAHKRA